MRHRHALRLAASAAAAIALTRTHAKPRAFESPTPRAPVDGWDERAVAGYVEG